MKQSGVDIPVNQSNGFKALFTLSDLAADCDELPILSNTYKYFLIGFRTSITINIVTLFLTLFRLNIKRFRYV